ncbi:MAG: FG-GAP-like repeat-containing protein [Bacteroidota bacterium]
MNLKRTTMTRKYLCATILLMALMAQLRAQSFTETSIPNLTTTPSDSRSANFIDVNGDGWDDIFITNGPASGADNMLYINNQDGTFTTITTDDITSDNDRSDGASFADADNDGDLDAFVVTFGASGQGKKNYFYRNNGDGSFTYEPDIAMGIPLTYSEMATWIDANNDQNLDLYFTNSVGSLRNLYFENQGDGSFQQVNTLEITNDLLPSRSVDWVDYDGDGDADLFVTNENNESNSLFRNDGTNNFTQITNLDIVLDNRNSAGSSWADIDNDGDFDLFIANYDNTGQANQLFINDGGAFTEDTSSAIASVDTNSFGSSFGDVDNDGDLDLLVCNAYLASQDTNFLYINDGSGNFTLDTSSELGNHQGWTFGCAFGDYNNDGWLDALLANNLNETQPNSLYRNTGTSNNWVKLNLTGTSSNHSAVGAVIRLRATINGNEVWQTRRVSASSGYCSQNSYTVHFGLGNATQIEELLVEWPVGTIQSFPDLDINQTHPIVEDSFGIDDNGTTLFKIYPNPTQEKVAITSQELSSIAYVSFTNLKGQTSIKTLITESARDGDTIHLDISPLSAGVYICNIFDVNHRRLSSAKIVKR